MCTLPKFGIEKEVRVCEACYMTLHAPTTNTARNNDSDLPAEYLSSSLAQQSQVTILIYNSFGLHRILNFLMLLSL